GEQLNRRSVDVLFIGDSLTEYWPTDAPAVWQAEFGHLRCVNLGVAGDTTSDVLARLQTAKLDHLDARVTVLLIGTNDISLGDGAPSDITRRVRSIVDLIRGKMPNSKLLLMAVFPRDYSPHAAVRETVRRLNSELVKIADEQSVFFLDIGQAFIDRDGFIPKTLMPDGVHLSEEGYAIWAENMRSQLQSLMQSGGVNTGGTS
ncbi:MAG TPA: GDSL-type esterase/lipase family protein, partial [Candidatus Obscuribacterales bacterium]